MTRSTVRPSRSSGAMPDDGRPVPTLPLDASFHGSIHERLSCNAAWAGERIALADPGAALSYAELDRVSDELARALRARGVGRGDGVAVLGRRRASLVWALLGVLKTGAAFLVLDHAYPPRRLVHCMRLASPAAFLEPDDVGELPLELEEHLAGAGLRCRLRLPRAASDVARALGDAPPAPLDPVEADDLACFGFTSGSTGDPKGIACRHGPLTQFLPWQARAFGLVGSDRYSLLSGLSHDPLQREVFTALWTGASVHVPPPEALGEPRSLFEWLCRTRITVLHATPSMLQRVLAGAGEDSGSRPEQLPDLRVVFTLGEALRWVDAASLRRVAPQSRCVSLYGSTETQRAVGFFEVPPDAAPAGGAVPLGRGVPGAQLLVLGEGGGLAAPGEPGEICVRSPHLARGYLDDEDLTRRRFVVNPFTGAAGDRLYRTGDQGFYLPDGSVAYLGRLDRQLKIRGHRVEPGEIEAVLARHPAVRRCAVAAPRGDDGQPRLVAFVVLDPAAAGGAALDAAALRAHLRAHLPEVMVPREIVAVDALPLTPNGKVDRDALPLPIGARSSPEGAAPGTSLEETIARVWSEVLGRDDTPVTADFFDLGGDSLGLLRAATLLEARLGVPLRVRDCYEQTSVRALAATIAARDAAPATSEAPARAPQISPGGRPDLVPLTPSQQALWFLRHLEPESAAYHVHLAYRIEGRLDAEALQRALDAVAARHEPLRATVVGAGDRPCFQIAKASPWPLAVERAASLAEAEREGWAERRLLEALRRPFDLEREPPRRAHLVEIGADRWRLALALHHLVADGWSLGLLAAELTEAYAATAAGRPDRLPDLPVTFSEHIARQQQAAAGPEGEALRAFWARALEGAPPPELLPTAAGAVDSRGARRALTLPAQLSRGLSALARAEGATLFMALTAGLALALHARTGAVDMVIGTDVAGRTRPGSAWLIGHFVNQLVLRVDLSGDPSFRQLLARVRGVVLSACAHQDLPFPELVRARNPLRAAGRNPLFQIMLVMEEPLPPPADLGGARWTPFELEDEAAPFDLSIQATDGPDGIRLCFRHRTGALSAAVVEELAAQWQRAMDRAVRSPDQPIRALTAPEAPALPAADFAAIRRERLEASRRRPQRTAIAGPPVRIAPRPSPGSTPLLVEAALLGVDLEAWLREAPEVVERALAAHGAVLFRGFARCGVEDAGRALAAAIGGALMAYHERSSPRTELADRVYTSTDHPPDRPISLHNEQSYNLTFPRRIAFCCLEPAARGGATPLADCRRVLQRIPAPIRARLQERRYRYVRNFGAGLGLAWPVAFQTSDPAEVEAYCREHAIEIEWRSGGALRTWQVRDVIARHPATGEPTWFNHLLFFHAAALEDGAGRALLSGLPADERPFDTRYGDGAPIEPEVIAALRGAYRAEITSFPWERGDLLLVDNLLTAHGREPFEGPRRVVVGMGLPTRWRDVAEVSR